MELMRSPAPLQYNIKTAQKGGGWIPKRVSHGAAVDSLKSHLGPVVKADEIIQDDMQWRDIGSGTFAKTFKDVNSFKAIARGGLAMTDVYRRATLELVGRPHPGRLHH